MASSRTGQLRGSSTANVPSDFSSHHLWLISLRTYPSMVLRNTAAFSSAHGFLGLNPDSFTLRKLVLMVEGKGMFDWAQTSLLMVLAVNLMRDPKKGKAVSLNDFNPFAEKPHKIVLKGSEMLDALNAAFIRNRKPC